MHTKESIWILEDEEGIQAVYDDALGLRYNLRMFRDVEELALGLASNTKLPSLLLADLRLPGQSFLSYLQDHSHEADWSKVRFLVVSGSDDLDALRACYSLGAMDYIRKPFTINELLAKIERSLQTPLTGQQSRQSTPSNANEGSLKLDVTTLTILRGDKTSEALTSKEFKIIALLSRAPSHTLSRKELAEKIWGGVTVSRKTLDVHMTNLRKKIHSLGLEIVYDAGNIYCLKDSTPATAPVALQAG